ncbi:ribonuclease H protein [Trifolium medium]|uniref:Ribonuclease H protein n=1 Tax=Trifolium medium TaxID=97028 RepID=A0A392M1L3_9FABA|nr:ribonuclease H protein [Trifolium medium]
MLFCKGSASNIQALSSLFVKYGKAFGQFVNPQKSSIFPGSIPHSRLANIAISLGFQIGSLPFTYLRVPIFKGKPKKCHLQPLADKVKLKLVSWKASLLTLAGRVQLVKSVIYSMLIHSITINAWPVSLIKDLERWSRNFIWSGNVNQRKLVTVAWYKVCLPFNEGGLGLSFSEVLKNSKPVSYYISSSIWSGIKHKFPDIILNCTWQIGNGEIINFWTDLWCGEPLINSLKIPQNIQHRLKATVSCFIENASWQIPQAIMTAYPPLQSLIDQVTLPVLAKEDSYLWIHSHDGNLSFKDAYSFHCQIGQQIKWATIIWNSAIPPSKSLLIWRCLHGKLPTDENLSLRGCCLPSRCSLCGSSIESSQHIFIDCSFAIQLWSWIGNPGPSSCGGIFRNSNAEFLGASAYNLGISNSLCAKLNGAMYAVGIAYQKGWKNLWLETDSMLVVTAFKSSKIIPWQLKNRWDNCILLLASMNFFVTHIFRKGNTCADIRHI